MKHLNPVQFADRRRPSRRLIFVLVWIVCMLLYAMAAIAFLRGSISSASVHEQTVATSDPESPLQTTPEATPAEDDKEITALAWGDVDNNRQLDLAVGYADGMVRIWQNRSMWVDLPPTGFINIVNSLAWGDMDGDSDLDLAVSGTGGFVIYKNEHGNLGLSADPAWVWRNGTSDIRSVAWGDMDGGGYLDLAVGDFSLGPLVFKNDGGNGFMSPLELAPGTKTTAVAWGDYNNDNYLDLAVAYRERASEVYKNRYNTSNQDFLRVWDSQDSTMETRSIAWGNFNGDEWVDLALGNYAAPNQVFKNGQTGFAESGENIGDESDNTTSIAWGYSDSKGTIELAVSNAGQPSRIYQYMDNADGRTGEFQQTWSSEAIPVANAVAWGDWNSDGDLDLAIGGAISPTLSIYANVGGSVGTPLVFINRPGRTGNAYFFSAAEVLGVPPNQNVEFSFALLGTEENHKLCYEYVDPDRQPSTLIAQTQAISVSLFGYTWYTVTWTPPDDGTIPGTTPSAYYISDNARIRVDRLCSNPQVRSEFTAYSPPFRLRATSCIWPEAPLIRVFPQFDNQALYQFIGQIQEGSGAITYTWEFGDGFTKQGQRVTHRYRTSGPYTVNLKVEGTPCPINRPRFATTSLLVGLQNPVFLPLVAQRKSALAAEAGIVDGEPIAQPPETPATLESSATLPQVTGLSGRSEETTFLTWQPPDGHSAYHGYRVYRYSLAMVDEVELLAELPPDVTQFNDQASHCDHAYYVTTFTDEGESDASTTTYYGLPCPAD